MSAASLLARGEGRIPDEIGARRSGAADESTAMLAVYACVYVYMGSVRVCVRMCVSCGLGLAS